MPLLIIETSTEQGCAAIVANGKVTFLAQIPTGLQNSTYLLPEIQRGLQLLDMDPQQLHSIAVGIGPGSYTGIRVGAIVAKTLSFALKKPLIGICSLKCFTPTLEGYFAVLIDAKIGGVYVLKGLKKGSSIQYLDDPLL